MIKLIKSNTLKAESRSGEQGGGVVLSSRVARRRRIGFLATDATEDAPGEKGMGRAAERSQTENEEVWES